MMIVTTMMTTMMTTKIRCSNTVTTLTHLPLPSPPHSFCQHPPHVVNQQRHVILPQQGLQVAPDPAADARGVTEGHEGRDARVSRGPWRNGQQAMAVDRHSVAQGGLFRSTEVTVGGADGGRTPHAVVAWGPAGMTAVAVAWEPTNFGGVRAGRAWLRLHSDMSDGGYRGRSVGQVSPVLMVVGGAVLQLRCLRAVSLLLWGCLAAGPWLLHRRRVSGEIASDGLPAHRAPWVGVAVCNPQLYALGTE